MGMATVNQIFKAIKPSHDIVRFDIGDTSLENVCQKIQTISLGDMVRAGVRSIPEGILDPTVSGRNPGVIRFADLSSGHASLLETAFGVSALPETRSAKITFVDGDTLTALAFLGALGALGADLSIEGIPALKGLEPRPPLYYPINPPDGGDYFDDIPTQLVARFDMENVAVVFRLESFFGWFGKPQNIFRLGKHEKKIIGCRETFNVSAFITDDDLKNSSDGYICLDAALKGVAQMLVDNEHGLSFGTYKPEFKLDSVLQVQVAKTGRVYPSLDAIPVNEKGVFEPTKEFVAGLSV